MNIIPVPTCGHAPDMTALVDALDDLREEFAQNELDNDRNPTEPGFLLWLAGKVRARESAGLVVLGAGRERRHPDQLDVLAIAAAGMDPTSFELDAAGVALVDAVPVVRHGR